MRFQTLDQLPWEPNRAMFEALRKEGLIIEWKVLNSTTDIVHCYNSIHTFPFLFIERIQMIQTTNAVFHLHRKNKTVFLGFGYKKYFETFAFRINVSWIPSINCLNGTTLTLFVYAVLDSSQTFASNFLTNSLFFCISIGSTLFSECKIALLKQEINIRSVWMCTTVVCF